MNRGEVSERAREIEHDTGVTSMARRSKEWAALGLLPLRQHWQEINRAERAAKARQRTYRKSFTKRRPKCTSDAYKFPHRPGGGLCRYPDPPAVRWQDAQAAEIAERIEKFKARCGEPTTEQMADLVALMTKPCRRHHKRYAGILRQIARNNGMHPIRDRDLIQDLLPRLMGLAKQLKRQCPKWKYKYRNMEIVDNGNGRYT